MDFLRAYKSDLERTLCRPVRWSHGLLLPWVHAGVRATLCYRLARLCRQRRLLRPIAAVIKRIGMFTTGAEISADAQIAAGLHLPHPHGVVIGPTVKILGKCTVFQQVTLGPRKTDGDPDDGPTLENNTYVYGGARVLGQVRIGERSQIGPNCVIFRDLAAGSTVLPPEPRVLEGLSFKIRETSEVTA